MDFDLHLSIVIRYLKERYTVFLKSKNLIFTIAAEKYLILFFV